MNQQGLWKGLLKEDFDLSSIDYTKVKPANPIQLLLMGSAAKLSGPKVKTVFVEDLAPEEAAKVNAEPSGLRNMGNTCYLNSVIQCLRTIPELRPKLEATAPSNVPSNSRTLPSTLSNLYRDLDATSQPVTPGGFLMAVRMAFPQFAEMRNGTPMQQDAEEFYSSLVTTLSTANPELDDLFGIKMEETLTCDELDTPDAMEVEGETQLMGVEPPVVTSDLHRKLVCNIQGGSDVKSQVNVTHIVEGINLSLSGKVEKRSEVLGRDAVWTRTQRMDRLPSILTVQFGRFFWKETPDSQDHAGVKCKVMKPVAFNGTLDVYEFCSERAKNVLKVARHAALKEEEDAFNKKLKGESGDKEDVPMSEDGSATVAEEIADAKPTEETLIGKGLPPKFQGKYELFAVVTHKGRDADGGHYMGWVKAEHQGETAKIQESDEDNADWFVFDDDEVSPCKTEDVLKLKGGGDWHMSYLNFYRAKK